jgi:NAD(P)-dependent dehydrogenase (short-subunit alcohol dehydrogenase family)
MTGTGTHAADGLAGKVALVVGGGWSGPDDYAIGIGGAICQHLARDGLRVAVLDIEDANAERTLAPILQEGGQGLMVDGGYGLLNVFDYSPYGRNLAATR